MKMIDFPILIVVDENLELLLNSIGETVDSIVAKIQKRADSMIVRG